MKQITLFGLAVSLSVICMADDLDWGVMGTAEFVDTNEIYKAVIGTACAMVIEDELLSEYGEYFNVKVDEKITRYSADSKSGAISKAVCYEFNSHGSVPVSLEIQGPFQGKFAKLVKEAIGVGMMPGTLKLQLEAMCLKQVDELNQWSIQNSDECSKVIEKQYLLSEDIPELSGYKEFLDRFVSEYSIIVSSN